MRVLAFLLLCIFVFAGVAAYSLHRKGLLTRETLYLYMGEEPEEDERVRIDVEPIGLALSVRESEEKLQEHAREIELKNERLQAQRKELDAQRAMLEQRMDELKVETGGGAAQGEGYEAGLGSMLGSAVISAEMLQLVKMYENMPPDEAADALENMPDRTVAQVLLQMRSRQAAQIMGELDQGKATVVGKLLSAEDGVRKLRKPEPVAAP